MHKIIGVAIASLAVYGSLVSAAPTNDIRRDTPREISGAAVTAGAARVDAVIDGTTIVRGTGVASVTSPGAGEYCVKLSKASLSTIPPALTVDWSNSSGNSNLVQWRSAGVGCAASGEIDVLTFTFNGSTFVRSGDVAFTIVIP